MAEFVQQGGEGRRDLRMLGREIPPLRRVRFQIIKTASPLLGLDVDELPSSLAERQIFVPGLKDESFVKRPALGLSEESREDTPTVFGGIVREGRTDEIGEGREQVAQADEVAGNRSRFDLPGPADDERDPMAALPDVALESPEIQRGFMPVGPLLASVVACHDEKRFVGDPPSP